MYFSFENNKCLNKKYENQQCFSTKECIDPMKCKDGLCKCMIGQHFDETELKCLNNTLVKTQCLSNRTCNSLLGLSCQNFECQCDLNIKYWSYKENKCVDLLSYGVVGCDSDKNCLANLKCEFEMCNCERSVINEKYWNGTFCANAGDK